MDGAYYFDGSGNRISFADSALLDVFSIDQYLAMAWVCPETGGNNNGRIFARADTSAGGPVGHMQMLVGNGTNGSRAANFTVRQKFSGNPALAVSADNVIPETDAWYCIGAHYNHGGSGSRLRLFNAGSVITPVTTVTPTGTIDIEDDQGFTIGNSFAGDRGYLGLLCYLIAYNVIGLSDVEIAAIAASYYGAGSGLIVVPNQDLICDFLRLDADGATSGDLGKLVSPTVTGAVFSATNPPPVAYDILGALPQRLRPDSDIDTASWSTPALYSKIDEDFPDGTMIYGAAV